MRTRGICLAALLALTACGPLPKPFQHETTSALVENRRSLAPVSVAPVAAVPGLDAALVTALAAEDIAATTQRPGPGALRLEGTAGGGRIIWSLFDSTGKETAWLETPLAPGKLDAAGRTALAAQIAKAISHKLRGDDSGMADVEAQPHVALHVAKTPIGVDAHLLRAAMSHALALLGYTVTDDKPLYVVEATLLVMPQNATTDLVQMQWQVLNAGGESLATVTQASPVDHFQLIDPTGPVLHDIAEAGAPAIVEVIHKRGVKAGP
jgi:hypothetical protein